MGVDVVLMRVVRQGTSPRRRRVSPLASVADEDGVIARTFSGSGKPMLSRVDPYGDLVLSPAEMGLLAITIAVLAENDPPGGYNRPRIEAGDPLRPLGQGLYLYRVGLLGRPKRAVVRLPIGDGK